MIVTSMFAGILRKFRGPPAPAVTESGQDWIGTGNALLGEGKLEEALSAYRRAMAAHPDSAPAHVNAGFVLQELGRHAEARPLLEEAVALDAGNLDAHYLLGKCLLAQGDFAGAAARSAGRPEAQSRFCLCACRTRQGARASGPGGRSHPEL